MRQCSGCREPKHTHIDTKMTVLEVVKEEHEYGEALLILLKTRRGVKYQIRVFENKPIYGTAQALKSKDKIKVKGWTYGESGEAYEDEMVFFNAFSISSAFKNKSICVECMVVSCNTNFVIENLKLFVFLNPCCIIFCTRKIRTFFLETVKKALIRKKLTCLLQ